MMLDAEWATFEREVPGMDDPKMAAIARWAFWCGAHSVTNDIGSSQAGSDPMAVIGKASAEVGAFMAPSIAALDYVLPEWRAPKWQSPSVPLDHKEFE